VAAPQLSWLIGVDVLVLITPGSDRRVDATLATVRLARLAGVPHVVVMSVTTADYAATIFGGQFAEIERQVKSLAVGQGFTYTLVRVPLFYENYFGFAEALRHRDAIESAIDPEQPYSPAAVSDIGEATANIAADIEGAYLCQTLALAGESHTLSQLTQWLGQFRGRPVTYEHITLDANRQLLLDFGFEAWQADGIIELYKLVNEGAYRFDAAELTAALGHPPLPAARWLQHSTLAARPDPDAGDDESKGEEAISQAASDAGAMGETSEPGRPEEAEDWPTSTEQALVADPGQARPRAPTLALTKQMDELFNEVFALEQQGRYAEATEKQAQRLVEIKETYDAARLPPESVET